MQYNRPRNCAVYSTVLVLKVFLKLFCWGGRVEFGNEGEIYFKFRTWWLRLALGEWNWGFCPITSSILDIHCGVIKNQKCIALTNDSLDFGGFLVVSKGFFSHFHFLAMCLISKATLLKYSHSFLWFCSLFDFISKNHLAFTLQKSKNVYFICFCANFFFKEDSLFSIVFELM